MCYKLITLKDGRTVPCNKCPKCIARRTSAWSFRLMQEERQSSSAHFITLTYDTDNVPLTSKGFMSLCKSDVQLFFKRLRKAQCGNGYSGIKYYVVGEYGGKSQRPHYHAICYNAQPELIDQKWDKGHVYFGTVTGASVGYTLKYMCKPKWEKKWHKHYGTLPEFALMSKGLGSCYLDNEENVEWHYADLLSRMYCTTLDGVKLSMPRYYKDKLYHDLERSAIAEANRIIQLDKFANKVINQSIKDVWNEQADIDAAFDRMYKSAKKQML